MLAPFSSLLPFRYLPTLADYSGLMKTSSFPIQPKLTIDELWTQYRSQLAKKTYPEQTATTVFFWMVWVAMTPKFYGPSSQSTGVIYKATLFSNCMACKMRLAQLQGRYFKFDLKILFLRLPLQTSLFSKLKRLSTSSSRLLSYAIKGMRSIFAHVLPQTSLKASTLWNCICSVLFGRYRISCRLRTEFQQQFQFEQIFLSVYTSIRLSGDLQRKQRVGSVNLRVRNLLGGCSNVQSKTSFSAINKAGSQGSDQAIFSKTMSSVSPSSNRFSYRRSNPCFISRAAQPRSQFSSNMSTSITQ